MLDNNKIVASKLRIFENFSYLYSLLIKHKISFFEDNDIENIAFSNENTIFLNKNIIEKEQNINNISFIILHELLHIELLHTSIYKNLIKNANDKVLINIAGDLVINESLAKILDISDNKYYKNGVNIKTFNKLLKKWGINKTINNEDVFKMGTLGLFRFLKENLKDDKNKNFGDFIIDIVSSNNNDEDNNDGDNKNKRKENNREDKRNENEDGEDIKNIKKHIKRIIKEEEKDEGVEGGFEGEIDEIEKIENIFREIKEQLKKKGFESLEIDDIIKIYLKYRKLKNFFKDFRSIFDNSISNKKIRTYAKINKKRDDKEIIYAGNIKKQNIINNLIVCLDSSGSISSEEYKQFLTFLINVFKSYDIRNFEIVAFDTNILTLTKSTKFNLSQILKILEKRKLSGGTDINNVLKYCIDKKFENLILFSDLYDNIDFKIFDKLKNVYVVVSKENHKENLEKLLDINVKVFRL